MIIVRQALHGVGAHFRTRAMEWFMTLMLLLWGIGLIAIPDIFQNPAYAVLSRALTAQTWGGVCLAFGLLRFTALFVNGTFKETLYSRYSPMVRAAFSFLSCGIWLTIALSFYASGVLGLAVGLYMLVLGFEVYCACLCAIDTDRALRNVAA